VPLSVNYDLCETRGDAGPGGESSRSLRHSVLLVLGGAALVAACAPGRPLPWLAWVAVAPLFCALRGQAPFRACCLAGLFGWLILFSTAWWLHAPLHDIIGLSMPGAMALIAGGCLLMAFPYVVAGFVTARWPRREGVWGAARDAAIFTTAIYWLTPVFHGNFAHTQYQLPAVFQVIELGGTALLLFLIFWVNCLLAESTSAWGRARMLCWKPTAAAVAIVALVLVYGVVRLQQFDAAMNAAPAEQWFTVGAIQPNIPIPIAPGREPAPGALANDFFSAVEQGRELALRHPELDAIAFPENPAVFVFNEDAARRQALGQLITQTGKPVILNVDAVDSASTDGVPARYNVAVWMDAERNLAGSYAKIMRIPIVEHLPGEKSLPWLRKWFPRSMRVLPGEGAVVFEIKPGIRVIPLVCYEGTVRGFARRFVLRGGNIIVNQVNDSWFLRTPASEVHLALTLYRTVEYRVPLVRVTNSGTGAHIQADGRIVPGSRTALFEEAATAFPLYVPPRRSVYTRLGDFWLIAFAALLLPRFGRATTN
jgi:apolipoprotein N-acyltransferase